MQPVDATLSFHPPGHGAEAGRLYLVIVEGDRSSLYPLPADGVVVIGRGEEADLPLSDQAASRRHARILVARGEARISDLGSHNGTKVNGETIEGAQPLVAGDVIGVCSATLVFHDGGRSETVRPLLDGAGVRRRLEEELARGIDFGRRATLIAVALAKRPEAAAVSKALAGRLRLIDVAGVEGQFVYVLCPELGAEAARGTAEAIAGALGGRVGLATFPVDGADAETLLAVARTGEPARTLDVGGRQIVVADPAMVRIYGLLERLAASPLPVLILGETGVGKENAAFSVHAWSSRAKQPFVTLNCAALQETLVESELFGYEKGAFSGAATAKPGLFETANGGTVFLDEVGELSPAAQAKLLRVIESQRVQRLGDVKDRAIDVRLVAATNRDLEAEVKAGKFRQDLMFRLSAATVVLPPLRERRREIPVLARMFLDGTQGERDLKLSSATLARLATWDWPGNVRELRNAIGFAAATCDEDEIQPWHLPEKMTDDAQPEAPVATAAAGGEKVFKPIGEELRNLERQRMVEALEAAGGVQRRAAELIQMPLRTFVLKYKQYGLKKD
jgi:DNA-binding NtrC family response regulator/pSer/pThr/pTyr-binding forkhead associated (FHA) protein